MTEADKIKKSILAEFDDVKSIDIIHSTGIVKAGEISLVCYWFLQVTGIRQWRPAVKQLS